MPTKVKRGLGLLVVAVIAYLIANPLVKQESMPALLVGVVAIWICVLAALVGLVLLAWGLLRD